MLATRLDLVNLKPVKPGEETAMDLEMKPTKLYHFVCDSDCWIAQHPRIPTETAPKAWFVGAGHEKIISGSCGYRLAVVPLKPAIACLAPAE
jgi:hypothetical protein